jgi:hypothetical protein
VLLSPERSQEAKSMPDQLNILSWGLYLIYVLIGGFVVWQIGYGFWGRKAKYQEILRFLQWAEHDIEEEQFRRRQRLCEEMPTPHRPV